jgi:Mg/Co/Ni transporter MgtE
MTPEVASALATEDQEEVVRRVQHYNFVAARRRWTRADGVVMADDPMDVAEEGDRGYVPYGRPRYGGD